MQSLDEKLRQAAKDAYELQNQSSARRGALLQARARMEEALLALKHNDEPGALAALAQGLSDVTTRLADEN